MTATTTTTTTTSTTTPSSTTPIPSGPVTAPLTFYLPPADHSTPYNYVETPPPGVPRSNYRSQTQPVQIRDIRGSEAQHTLDTSAFQALSNVPSSTTYETFDSDEAIRRDYYPEVERLLLDTVPGAHKVVIFDHTVRRSDPSAPRGPVGRVHVDQTPRSAAARVRRHVSDADEAERLLKGRYRIINVWRPLSRSGQPVVSNPLAFADSRSVKGEDLVAVEHRYPDRVGETAGVKWREGQEWFYWSGMRGDERVLLKCADENCPEEVQGRRVPHSAFVDPRTPEGAEGRESVEVRTLVFG